MAKSKRNRKKGRRTISFPLALAMIIFLAAATFTGILAYEWLKGVCLSRTRINEVTIKGNRRINSETILEASNLRLNIDSIYSIMPHILEKRIKSQLRYLKRVSIKHKFAREKRANIFSWITIEVEEKDPVAIVGTKRNAESFMIIDSQGDVLEKIKAGAKSEYIFPHENLPVIISDNRELNSEKQDNMYPAVELALDVLMTARSMIPELFKEISCIDANKPDNIVLLLQEKEKARGKGNTRKSEGPDSDNFADAGSGYEVTIRLASDQIGEGLSNILPVITRRREENKVTKIIDARFSGVVYCSEEPPNEGRWKSG